MNDRRDDVFAGDVLEEVSALLDGEVMPEDAATLDARLAADPVLREEADALAAARDLVRSLPEPTPPEGFWDDVGSGVRRRLHRRRRRAAVLGAAGGALAAAAVAAAFVVVPGQSLPGPPDFERQVARHHAGPAGYELTSAPVDFLGGGAWRSGGSRSDAVPSARTDAAAQDGRALLVRAADARDRTDYSGRVRVDLRWPGEAERVAHVSVVREGDRVRYTPLGGSGATAERSPLVAAADRLELLDAAGYRVTVGPPAEVAGRPAGTVVVRKGRTLLRRVAVDDATDFPLMVEDYSGGRLWRREAFESIALGESAGASQAGPAPRVAVRPPFVVPARVGDMALVAVERHDDGIRSLYGDGVRSASLFQVAGERARARGADTVRLAGRAFQVVELGAGRLWYWTTPEVTFSLVGDLPPDAATDFLRTYATATGSRGRPAGN